MISDPASNVHSALPQVTFGRNSSSSSDSSNWFRSTCSVRLNSERKKQQQNKFQKKQSALIVTVSSFNSTTHQMWLMLSWLVMFNMFKLWKLL